MAAAAEEKTEVASTAAPSGGRSSKLVLILTGVNVLATLAMVGVLFMSFQKEKMRTSVEDIAVQAKHDGGDGHGDGKKDEGHGEAKSDGHGAAKGSTPHADLGKMIALEPFTVNLSTPGSVATKFARVKISVEVPNSETETEFNSKIPQVQNVIIDLFNSKRPMDLQNAEGRDYLKEEIRNAINGFLVNGKIKGVFFTNFTVST